MSCDTPINRVLAGSHPRKHSLELSVPKITISDTFEKQGNTIKCINVRSDRTISESNLSTSGYSSLSSPGISRCSSSSPIHEDLHCVEIPSVSEPEAQTPTQTRHSNAFKQKSTYGNFLTIPTVTYPMLPHHPPSPSPKSSAKPTGMEPISEQGQIFTFDSTVTQQPSISRRPSQESRDEGIDVTDQSSVSTPRRPMSPTISSKRERLSTMKKTHQSVDVHQMASPSRRAPSLRNIQNSRSFEGEQMLRMLILRKLVLLCKSISRNNFRFINN